MRSHRKSTITPQAFALPGQSILTTNGQGSYPLPSYLVPNVGQCNTTLWEVVSFPLKARTSFHRDQRMLIMWNDSNLDQALREDKVLLMFSCVAKQPWLWRRDPRAGPCPSCSSASNAPHFPRWNFNLVLFVPKMRSLRVSQPVNEVRSKDSADSVFIHKSINF